METSKNLSYLLSKENIENALKLLNGKFDTPSIKRTFASLFKGTGFYVYANINGYNNNEELIEELIEWLFDLIVVQEIKNEIYGQQDYLTDTILSLESEMSSSFNGVMYDFQKLLISNSKYKVILFRCHSSELDLYFNYMIKNIKHYKSANGKFYLIGYANNGGYYTVKEESAIININ